MDIGRQATKPHRILTQAKIETYIIEAERGLTLMGTAPPTDTKRRSRTRWQNAASQARATTSQLRDQKLWEERLGTRNGSKEEQHSEEGQG